MSRDYAVIDDFLAQADHLALWDAFQRTAPENLLYWNRAYRSAQGSRAARALEDETATGQPGPVELRALSEKLFALMTGDPPIALDPWTGFTQSAWTYRAGHGLEWHSDTGWLAGYIYYMHPAWKASWGGELLVAAGDAPALIGNASARTGDPRDAVRETVGAFLYPCPNRLVLLKGGTMHCIKKVESAAGKAFRASVSGFFFNTPNANAGS